MAEAGIVYPVHRLVWDDKPSQLRDLLAKDENDIENLDLQGRTPLHLAVILGNIKCIEVLLEFNASTSVQSSQGWSVVKEAISTGDENIARLLVRYEHNDFDGGVPRPMQTCLDTIKTEPDLYFEVFSHMKVLFFDVWSSRLKVWKKGAYYRADVENFTFISKIHGDTAFWASLDHKKRELQREETKCPEKKEKEQVPESKFQEIWKKPVMTYKLNTDLLMKEGLKSTGEETVNGYECTIYRIPTIQGHIIERSDHLKEKQSRPNADVTASQYFTGKGMDIQPAMNLTQKDPYTYKREANIWVCKDHPISMKGHLMPILDMLSHYYEPARGMRQFFIEHVPSGCPVKATVEIDKSVISWFPVETTLENVFGETSPAEGVTMFTKNGEKTCTICDSVFDLPANYKEVDTQTYMKWHNSRNV